MKRFAQLFHELDATTSTSEKVALLSAYFISAPAGDAAWALALLTGNRPKGAATTGVLKALAIEAAGIPEWLLRECHAAVGDLSETIALLLPEPAVGEPESLAETMPERVLPLGRSGESDKRAIIRDAWARLGGDERVVYHKLIRGGFRIGVQRRLVARALGEAFGIEPDIVQHRLMGRFEATPDAFSRVVSGEEQAERDVRGYPFFLAHPLAAESVGEVGRALGDADDWIAERKWDGIRAQLVWRRGEATLWSRGEGLIGEQFPELLAAARGLPDGTVLDGEVLLWRGGTHLTFAALQKRLNRKIAPTHQLSLFDDTRVMLVAYDLLESDGEDLRGMAFEGRRRQLESVVADLGDQAAASIRLSEVVAGADWATMIDERARSRALGVEGLMLKHRRSTYGVGRTRASGNPGWYKWKVEPYTADAVMVGAHPGSGRRASLYTDYVFAVWDGEGDARELVTFARAYSGLTQEEIERLDAWIRSNTTAKRGPFRQVAPTQVFELAFEGLQESDRHKSGIAVRFPRIKRWRTDKPASEADTLATLRALLGEQGPPREAAV
ncbi:MAG: ATP-dependent DNA ligase [Planctomycetota bacterium]